MIPVAREAHARCRAVTAALALFAFVFAGPPLSAQHPQEITTRDGHWLVASARSAAARFVDRREAIAEGYRRVGPDFPFMGEHWVQTGLLVDGTFDVDRPPVLTYVLIDGAPVLVGVAYALPLGKDDTLPTVPEPDRWHDHSSTVDEESILIHSVLSTPSRDAPRLAMLHVWTGLPNPLGDFAQDNLAIPFARHSLRPPARVERTTSRALSLSGGGERYYRWMFRRLAQATGPEADVIDSAVHRAAVQVDRLLASAPATSTLSEQHMAELTAIWRALFTDLRGRLPVAMMQRLDPIGRDGPSEH